VGRRPFRGRSVRRPARTGSSLDAPGAGAGITLDFMLDRPGSESEGETVKAWLLACGSLGRALSHTKAPLPRLGFWMC
jgi:hypothetical protein